MLLALLGCGPPSVGTIDVDLLVPDLEQDTGIESVGSAPDEAAFLFGTEQVVDVEIEISDASASDLTSDPFEYVPVSIRIDGGEWLDDVAIRIKGRIGSYRTLSGKPGLRVDFDRFVEGRRWKGLKAMTLNNMVNDYAQIHEIVAYPFYEHVGIAAPRVGYAWLTINDSDYGLYANIETPDDHWLERVYSGHDDGNFYEADYMWYPDGSYDLVDFTPTQYHLFELDEGTDVGFEDILEIVDSVQATAGTEDYDETTGEFLDWPHFWRFWATEVWLGQWDGYNYNTNNYRLYFDPDDGKADLLPWGHDWVFHDWRTWTTPRSTLGYWCLYDSTCTEGFLDELVVLTDMADAYPFAERIDEAAELAAPYIEADPRKEISADTAYYYQDIMRDWITWRSQAVQSWWGVADPEVTVGTVSAGSVEVITAPDALSLDGAEGWNYGGETVAIEDVDFVATYTPGTSYSGNVPDLEEGWTGIEQVLYSCQYASPGYVLELSFPVEPGEELTVQLLMFEPYYSWTGNRVQDITVEGEVVVEDLDVHTMSNRGGLVYTLELTAADDSLDVLVSSSATGDGHTIISGVTLVRE